MTGFLTLSAHRGRRSGVAQTPDLPCRIVKGAVIQAAFPQ